MLYLFDIDGTLLLSGGAGTRALNGLFAERYGVEGAMASVRAAGNTDPLILAEIFRSELASEPSDAELEELFAAYVPRLRRELENAPKFRTMPSAEDTLQFLADRPEVSLAVATGNIRAAAWAKLERAGLSHYFSAGGFGCDHAERPLLLERAIERATAEAGAGAPTSRSEMVVVGDTPRDVSAARACGVRAIAVATGVISRAELEEASPDAVMSTLAELPAWHAAQTGAAPITGLRR